MKIGMISFAHMHAYSYAKSLLQIPGVELAGIADDNPERGERMAAELGTSFVDLDELLARADVAAVIICSENSKHRYYTELAAKAGKHVMVEKPIATTVADAQAMIQACADAGVKLQVAFPCRFIPAVRRAKEAVEQGRLGRLIGIRASNHGRNPGGWFIEKELSGGGAVMDHTVHVVDLIRWIFASEFTEVYAEADSMIHGISIDDCGLLSMKLENGAFATLDPSWSRPSAFPTWGDVKMEIVGTNGVISIDAFKQRLDVYSEASGHRYLPWGGDMDFHLVKDFVDTVALDREPFITGYDGLKALEVALAAYKSADSHQVVNI